MRLLNLCAIALLAAPAASAVAAEAGTSAGRCDPIWFTGMEPHVDPSCIGSLPTAGSQGTSTRCDTVWWTGVDPHVDPSCAGVP